MSDIHDPVPHTFPADFVWGSATASYQIEGYTKENGAGPSIWDTFAATPGKVRNFDNGDIACDHYHRYEEDLDLLKELGVKEYRFSISWPRIQANGTGAPIAEGLAFYRRLVEGLRARNIEPAITLYHWDLPQALQDKGGWASRDTALAFGDYVGHVVDALGDLVNRWITINEPWCVSWLGYGVGVHAPGIQDAGQAVAANHHILLAHGLAVQEIRKRQDHAKVGITLNVGLSKPATDHELDVAATARANANYNEMFLGPVFKGTYPELMRDVYKGATPGFSVVLDGDLDIISAPLDFLGVNHYSYGHIADVSRIQEAREAGYNYAPSNRAKDPMYIALGATQVEVAGRRKTAMGWEVDSTGLRDILQHIAAEYTSLPIYITENGAAYDDYVSPSGVVNDAPRIQYLREYIGAVAEAMRNGVDVRGYFVWSLLDNYEWAEGYSRRFGIIWVDFPTGNRLPKDSYRWYQNLIKTGQLN